MATPNFKDDTFLARWLSGELSVEEEAELRSRPDFAAYERMMGNLNRMAPPAFDTKEEFQKLKSERALRTSAAPQQPVLHPRPRLMRRILPWSAAAAVALLLVAWFLLRPGTDSFEAANGDQQLVAELTDGSTARLNAGSDLAFAVTTTERSATLNGEAYFEVEKAAIPFVVQTSLGEVSVLGTSFNVYSRNGEMAVSCTTGKVSVCFEGDAADYLITPGQSVGRNRLGEINFTETTSPEELDWLSGKSVFINRPLAEILDELERQFDLTVERPAALNLKETYEVTFPNDDLDTALGMALGSIKGYKHELEGTTIRLIPEE
ncbi:MAG: ferric-dicitrate binding protein FerR (iron transport regulator) [Neolewinella sp.]|jgi:transmembrane sensor